MSSTTETSSRKVVAASCSNCGEAFFIYWTNNKAEYPCLYCAALKSDGWCIDVSTDHIKRLA